MFFKNRKLSANEDSMKEVNEELSKALKFAKFPLDLNQFARKCKITDLILLEDMAKGRLIVKPPREILRTIAANSNGNITHTYLYNICEYSENDPEEKRDWMTFVPERGEIYFADFGWFNLDAEQCGVRSCVIISNNVGNSRGSVLMVAPTTTQPKRNLPTHFKLSQKDGMREDSTVMLEQSRCISKRRLFYNGIPWKITQLKEEKVFELNTAIEIEFGLTDVMFNEEKAFKMVEMLKDIEYTIKSKKANNLWDTFNKELEEFINYCKKYKKDSDYIIARYEMLNAQACAV